jgi:formylglycine-generating enzyme required for sulfatase activity
MSQWTPGQRLKDGKYTIEELLGFGGFGVTYRAREHSSGQLIAIKTLNALQQNKPNFAAIQEKFVNEAMCLASCRHPHIVKVYPQLFQQDGLWCMVMEYIEGHDLASYLEDRGVLSEEEALRIIRQVGEALTYVHNQGFLHRDVKPANIILRRGSLDAVLIDFGLAREFVPGRVRSLTNHKTEGFAPIEQYERRGDFGAYTDVYALAATLYNVLTDKSPPPANFRKEFNVPLVPPKQHNPQISDRVNDAILKGMALEPKDRPQSVQEWLELFSSPQLPIFRFEVVTVDRQGKISKRSQHQAQYFVEDLGKGVKLEMVAIPGGTFLMGSPQTEEGHRDWESPQHKVTLLPFYIGKYPVTQAQWQAVAALRPVNESLNPDPSEFKGANRPVEHVSWYEAVEFCSRLSRRTGREYCLPSEAQWEYACRAGTTTPFYFGETITPDLANYRGNYTYAAASKSIYGEQTTDVGTFPPNPFGLYDMHGNVWEWCTDHWHENYQGAPPDGRAWNDNNNQYCWNDNDDQDRLMRGGSWYVIPTSCRSACRYSHAPGDRQAFNIGFRIVCAAARTP